MTTGQKITKLRKANDITQEELADKLGVSRQSVSKWESDLAYPETDKLIALATLFNCSVDYLLKDGEAEKQADKQADDRARGEAPKAKKKAADIINMKGMPLAISTLAFAVLGFIVLAVSRLDIPYGYYGYSLTLSPNFYDLSFYKITVNDNPAINLFALMSFLLTFAVLALGGFYFFFNRRKLALACKIVGATLAGFYILTVLFGVEYAAAQDWFFAVLVLAYAIAIWFIKPFRYHE
ncbi:MAG: helix-turn-helix domain-containing protein [Bacilli bacterium]|jgi:transcriptional regulator with XRE-family HTH domain|nr:helix-turn-helix domain-containing protein [Bacilli bacterium]